MPVSANLSPWNLRGCSILQTRGANCALTRIRKIHEHSKAECWSVKSAENPADLRSRSSPLDTPALQKFWLPGPDWLAKGKQPLETQWSAGELPEEALAERRAELSTAAAAVREFQPLLDKQFSSGKKLVRIVAHIRKKTGKVPGDFRHFAFKRFRQLMNLRFGVVVKR